MIFCQTKSTVPNSPVSERQNLALAYLGWHCLNQLYLYAFSSISTIRYTTPIRKVRGYPSYHRFAKKFYREVFEKGEYPIPAHVYFHCFSMNGCSTFTALWDLLDKRPGGDEFKERVQGIFSPAFTTPAQSAHAISFASMPPARYHAVFRETYRAFLYAYLSIHHGLVWMWSLMESDVYEKFYAYYRMLSIKDLPRRQIYFYGPGDDVSLVMDLYLQFMLPGMVEGSYTCHTVKGSTNGCA
ncbi:hypothetical protein ANCCEY_10571 [Ancylostoma ceylanicum]|uniref:Uncharacterized protein n=1 Tax=Ancylostoma ceylanicum TaxID=53326 RepID=A0A0D6LGQ1_9BILA|nr:hypothetical protein ANCCEY_10571 [Ancylostoma ceylanicum]